MRANGGVADMNAVALFVAAAMDRESDARDAERILTLVSVCARMKHSQEANAHVVTISRMCVLFLSSLTTLWGTI